MSPEWLTVLLIAGLLILLGLGVEIAVGMGIIASVSLLILDKPLIQIAWSPWESIITKR